MAVNVDLPFAIPAGAAVRLSVLEQVLHTLSYTLQQTPGQAAELNTWAERYTAAEEAWSAAKGRSAPRGLTRKRAFAYLDRWKALQAGLRHTLFPPPGADGIRPPQWHIAAAMVLLGPNVHNPKFAMHLDFADCGLPLPQRATATATAADDSAEERHVLVDASTYSAPVDAATASAVARKAARTLITHSAAVFGDVKVAPSKMLILLLAAPLPGQVRAAATAASSDDMDTSTGSVAAAHTDAGSDIGGGDADGLGDGWVPKPSFYLKVRAVKRPRQPATSTDDADSGRMAEVVDADELSGAGDDERVLGGAGGSSSGGAGGNSGAGKRAASGKRLQPRETVWIPACPTAHIKITGSSVSSAPVSASSATAAAVASGSGSGSGGEAPSLLRIPRAAYTWYQWVAAPTGFAGPLPAPPVVTTKPGLVRATAASSAPSYEGDEGVGQ